MSANFSVSPPSPITENAFVLTTFNVGISVSYVDPGLAAGDSSTGTINNAILSPSQNSPFSIVNAPGFPTTLTATSAGGSEITFQVQLSPQLAGSYSTTLTVITSLQTFTVSITVVIAQATGFTVSPTVLSFPGTVIGSASSPLTATVHNTSSSSISVTGAFFSNTDFTLINPPAFPVTLAAGGTLTLQVVSSPTVQGIDTGTMRVDASVGGTIEAYFINVVGVGLLFIESNPLVGTDYVFLMGFGMGSGPTPSNQVVIMPGSATLAPGGSQQFTANMNVTWTTNVGTIDSSGLYTAPANLTQATIATVTATSAAGATSSVSVSVQPTTVSPADLDLLAWMTLNSRASQHLAGDPTAPYEVQWLDTDAGYPSNYPANTLWFIKNKLGNPWDVLRYDQNYLSYWITDNGDAQYQAQCQAANATGCWLYARAYKRNQTAGGIHIMPRLFAPGSTITIDNPAANSVVRTADCEATSDVIDLGPVRGITTGPFKISWGGSIDSGSGTLPNGPNYDNVNGVDTIKNQYMYTQDSSQPSGYADIEETYYVLGFGRVAWYYYAEGVFQQKTVNTTVVTGGHPAPNFPCGPGKSWFV